LQQKAVKSPGIDLTGEDLLGVFEKPECSRSAQMWQSAKERGHRGGVVATDYSCLRVLMMMMMLTALRKQKFSDLVKGNILKFEAE